MLTMQTLDAIKTRRAVREWNDTEISEETLLAVLDAGRFAPSPLNSQPWHFTVVRDRMTIQRITKIANHGSFLAAARLVVVVTVNQGAKVDRWLSEHEQHIYSGVCAMQNMWLASWDMGLGACWVTVDDAATRKMLAIPENQKLLGSLALGYPAVPAKPHDVQDRRPLADMVSYEKFAPANSSLD